MRSRRHLPAASARSNASSTPSPLVALEVDDRRVAQHRQLLAHVVVERLALARVEQVDLVRDEDAALVVLDHVVGDREVLAAHPLLGVEDEQRHVRAAHRLARLVHRHHDRVLAARAAGAALADARRVRQLQRLAAPRERRRDRVARRPRRLVDDDALLAEHRVEQRRLAHVRPPDHRHLERAEVLVLDAERAGVGVGVGQRVGVQRVGVCVGVGQRVGRARRRPPARAAATTPRSRIVSTTAFRSSPVPAPCSAEKPSGSPRPSDQNSASSYARVRQSSSLLAPTSTAAPPAPAHAPQLARDQLVAGRHARFGVDREEDDRRVAHRDVHLRRHRALEHRRLGILVVELENAARVLHAEAHALPLRHAVDPVARRPRRRRDQRPRLHRPRRVLDEPVEERGLAGVGRADNREARQLATSSAIAKLAAEQDAARELAAQRA